MPDRWFLADDIPLALCTDYHHQSSLVVVSYLIAAFAAYTAFHLIARVRAAGDVTSRLVWLATAGMSMGFGIWAMHFIAILAVEIPIPIRFDLPITMLSGAFAVLASAIAFHLVAGNAVSRTRLALAGVVLGSGIGLMHYVGMAALSMPAHVFYDPWLFALSVVVAILLAIAALVTLTTLPRLRLGRGMLPRLFAAAVMGLAIVLMHYTGMFATYFYPDAGMQQAGALLDPPTMGAAIGVVALLLVGLALVAALFDQRVERAETLLRDAIDSISEGFVIYDSEDRLVMCNEIYRKFYPEAAHVMVPGATFEEISRLGLANQAYADGTGREEQWLAERIRQHQEATGTIEQRRSDGRWFLITDRRMRNGGIAGLRIDITALKSAQAALRESEQRLDRAQEIAGIGSWELDVPNNRYIWSRQMYRLRGLPEDFDPTGPAVARYLHPDDEPMMRQYRDDLKAGIERDPIEGRCVRPDGEIRLLRVEGRPIVDPDGVIRRLIGTMQDVTERRRTERQLAQAQRMETVGQLTGGLAHDFNNILGAVIGNIDLAQENIDPGSPAARNCQVALDAALRGSELVKRLLAFSRRQKLHPRATNLKEVIADLLPLVERTLGEHIRIATTYAGDLWPAMADAAQLESAILNLIVNARDAMPNGGTLSIEAANVVASVSCATRAGELQAGDYAVISVTDTGCGMSQELLAHAFEPFFTTKGPAAGSGLGLSMVLGTLQQLGGAVQIDSEVERGTTVRLYLPRAYAAEPAIAQPQKQIEPLQTGHEHILLVEDNADLRELGTEFLRGLGYRVTVAANGDEAVRRIENGEHFDLLFTDILMPGRLNGVALAQELRERDPSARILFSSGFANSATLNEDVQALDGAELISKPYRNAELAAIVRTMLNRATEAAN